MTNERLLYLLERYLAGIANAEEASEVDAWYESFESKPALDLTDEKSILFFKEKTILQNPES